MLATNVSDAGNGFTSLRPDDCGARVTLVFPRINDSWVVAAASRSFYRRMLEAGCMIFGFRDGLLHARTLTIDARISLIGSSILDLRSFDLNYENSILLQDREMTAAIHERQRYYISGSDPIELAQVLAWPCHRRIWNNAIGTMGPLL